MKAKAVIFDLDGTLLDTLQDLADSLNAMLRSFGFREHPVEAVKGFIGDGMENLVRRAASDDAQVDDALIRQCLDVYTGEYEKRWNLKTRPYEGIPELLEALAVEGVPMAVLSNKLDSFTKMGIAENFPDTEFVAVFGQREGIPKKPDPAGALEIAGLIGSDPSEVIFLGDSSVDMRTGRAAGMVPVGVSWGFRTVEELWETGATEVINEPGTLLELASGPG